MEVHQLTQGFSRGDATSNMALKMQEILHDLGHGSSSIFSMPEHIGSQESERCFDYHEHRRYSGRDGILMYHYGNASPLSEYYSRVPDRKVLVFHNVTPSCYFRALSPTAARKLERARDDLEALGACTDLCCGISRYNLSFLSGMNFRRTMHFPAWIDESALRVAPSAGLLGAYRDDYVNLLFVGRVAPNKKIEDLIRTYRVLKRGNPGLNVRLFVVGTYVGTELYHAYLLSLCKDMGLTNVVFSGHVSQAELNAYYALADAFVCASEHEGFCIPLMEAAFHGVPVFAFDIPGVRETLDGCGVLFSHRDFVYAAETIGQVLGNAELKQAIVAKQKERLHDFREELVRERLVEVLERCKTIT